jgi:SnoaL-like domain
MTTDTTDTEALVRRAYQLAEGNVMDVRGFMDLFADDGVVNAGGQSYRGEHLGDLVVSLGKQAPDVHRELRRVHAMGNLVSVELSIQGTFTGPFETPAGVLQLTGAKLDIPGADVWYVEGGKIKEFSCNVDRSSMLAQLGVHPDFASAVEAQAAER